MNDIKRIEIFERVPVKKAVLFQIVPAIASQMIALAYNLADTLFVGMLNDPRQTASIMVVSSPFILLTAVSNLFGIGGASALSRSLGKGDTNGAKKIAAIATYLGALTGIAFSLLFWALSMPVLKLCGADASTMEFARGYAMWVVIIGGPFNILGALLANLIRAEGSSLAASIGVSAGGLLNILLDPFFVLPSFLNMGVKGAGLATAISNFAVAAYFVILICARRKSGIANFNITHLKHVKAYIKPILLAGFPSALQYILTVIGVAAHTHFTSAYGNEATAALGIVKKLDQLPLFFSIGVATGLLPLLAYNHAAGNKERRHKAFVFGCAVSFGFSLICLALYELIAPQLARVFIDNQLTVNYAASFLRRMVTAMPMMSVCYPMIIQFQATGKVKESIICSLLRKGLIDIPLYFAMDAIAPLYGLMWVQPIVDTVSLVVAVAFYVHINKRERRENVRV